MTTAYGSLQIPSLKNRSTIETGMLHNRSNTPTFLQYMYYLFRSFSTIVFFGALLFTLNIGESVQKEVDIHGKLVCQQAWFPLLMCGSLQRTMHNSNPLSQK